MAEEANVDLVEIAPNAVPPVCRLMDYGKFGYRAAKKAHEAKLEAEEHPGQGDEVPAGHRRRRLPDQAAQPDYVSLEEGDKTKMTLRYRGREMAHQEIGCAPDRASVRRSGALMATVEQFPKMEGRQMIDGAVAPKKMKPSFFAQTPAARPVLQVSWAPARLFRLGARTRAPDAPDPTKQNVVGLRSPYYMERLS